jgi:HEAT repeat protein
MRGPRYRLLAVSLVVAACHSPNKSAPSKASATASEARPAPSATPSATAAPVQTPELSPGPVPAWRVGDRRVYATVLTSSAHVNDAPLTEFTVSGELQLTAVERNDERVLLHGLLRKPKFKTQLTDKKAEFDELAPALASPFLVELGPSGVIRRLHFSDHPSGLVIGIRRMLAAALQGQSRAPLSAWDTTEYDAMGPYVAHYEAGEAGKLHKSKLRYFPLVAQGDTHAMRALALTPEVRSSGGTVELNAEGLPEAVQWSETVLAGLDSTVPITNDASLTLTAIERTLVPKAGLPAYEDLLQHGTIVDPEHPWLPPFETRSDEARIAHRTLDQVLDKIRELSHVPEPSADADKQALQNQKAEVFEALQALVRRKPDTIPRLVTLIHADDPIEGTLIDALGASGSADAQAALVRLIQSDKLSPVLQKSATISLSRSDRPSKQSVAGLEALLEVPTLHVQAMYGLGTSVRHLREAGDEKLARRVLDLIIARLDNAKGTVEQVTALRAIANSGHDAAFPKLQPLLKSPNDEVRAAAVEALQVMNVPQAGGLLADSILHDQAVSVRLAGLRAALVHASSPGLTQAVVSAAHADPEPHVRLGALQLLIAWLPMQPKLRAEIERIEREDKEQDIRRAAAESLAHS